MLEYSEDGVMFQKPSSDDGSVQQKMGTLGPEGMDTYPPNLNTRTVVTSQDGSMLPCCFSPNSDPTIGLWCLARQHFLLLSSFGGPVRIVASPLRSYLTGATSIRSIPDSMIVIRSYLGYCCFIIINKACCGTEGAREGAEFK